jgi:hypothetical protein
VLLPSISVIFLPSSDPDEIAIRREFLNRQTFNGFEVIEVDGGENLSKALNEGLTLCRADKIAISLPLWKWHPRFLERMNHESDADSTCKVAVAQVCGAALSTLPVPQNQIPEVSLQAIATGEICYLGACLFEKAVLQEVGRFDSHFQQATDREFMWRLCRQNQTSFVLERVAEDGSAGVDSADILRGRRAFLQARSTDLQESFSEEFLRERWENLSLAMLSAGERSLATDITQRLVRERTSRVRPSTWLSARGLAKYFPAGLLKLGNFVDMAMRKVKKWSPPWALLAGTCLLLYQNRDAPQAGGHKSPKAGSGLNARTGKEDLVVGVYLTSQNCPQRGVAFSRRSLHQASTWYRSLLSLGLRPVILHDGLSEEVLAPIRRQGVLFEQVETGTQSESPNDRRFRLYLKYLADRPEIEQVFFTDVTDVTAYSDPFELFSDRDQIFVGSEGRVNGSSLYMWKTTGEAYGWGGRTKFLRILNKPVLNCGILGGRRGPLMRLLSEINEELDRTKPQVDSNMVTLNLAAYRLFSDHQIVTGYPLHSRFKSYEPRRDVCFLHK